MEKEVASEEPEIMTQEEGLSRLSFGVEDLPTPQDIEKRTSQYLSYLRAVMKVTRPQDWNFFKRKTTDGKEWKLFRLSQFAAKRLRVPLGVSLTNVKRETLIMTDERGDFPIYIYSGIATWGKMEIYVEGKASNRDKFFAYAHGEWKPLTEVKQLDLLTAAYNNLVKKAVIDTFGLGDFTAEDLKQLGFDPDAVIKGHEFSSGEGKKEEKPPTQNGTSKPANDAQRKMIYAKGKGMGWDDEAIDKFILDKTLKKKKDLTSTDINILVAAYGEFQPPKGA